MMSKNGKHRNINDVLIIICLMIVVLSCGRGKQVDPSQPVEVLEDTPVQEMEQEPAQEEPLAPVADDSTCVDSMVFIDDVSIPDGYAVNANEAFIKTWRVQNSGTCFWSGYVIAYESGEPMGTMEQGIPDMPAGETFDISVEMTAPGGSGSYTGRWEVRTPDGVPLGGLTCVITVPSPDVPEDPIEEGGEEPDGGGDVCAPAAPTNLHITGWDTETFNVAWDDNSNNEDGFKIRRVGHGWLKNPTGPDATSFSIHYTPCGESYQYRVVAFNAAGNSEPSNTITVDGQACE
jgi:hypothetical protein